jgi:hypothetical protein
VPEIAVDGQRWQPRLGRDDEQRGTMAVTARLQRARKYGKLMAWQMLRASLPSAIAKDQARAPGTIASDILPVLKQPDSQCQGQQRQKSRKRHRPYHSGVTSSHDVDV